MRYEYQIPKVKGQSAVALFALCALASGMCYAKPQLSGSAQKHDKHAPIEITSDALEVFQEENRAVFSGHVVAIQAEDRLKADEMIVHYRKQDDQPADKNAKPAKADKKAVPDAANPMGAGAITKIDTKGHVFLSTPEETASGDYGDYDVDAQLVHLNDHVVLTKGPNVLKGDHLTYNLDTGKSQLTSAGGTPVGGTGDSGKQRVHALFVPESKDKPKAAAPSPQPETPPQQ